MRALVGPPTLPLRKPFVAGALPLSIVVDIVEVSGLGEGERILRIEDTLKVECESESESESEGGDGVLCRNHCQWQKDDKRKW